MVVVLEVGFITPPAGLNVFVIRGVSGGFELNTIIRGGTTFSTVVLCGHYFLDSISQNSIIDFKSNEVVR
jgi:TRAP-type C4-dicarboxylate transport system permease large subunit